MTTAVFTEGRHRGEYIKSEARGDRSRDNVTIASGAGLIIPGQVLGQISASGKYLPQKKTATDGSQVAAAIAYGHYDATSADAAAVITARDSEVFGLRLTYDASISAAGADLTAAAAALAELGIIIR